MWSIYAGQQRELGWEFKDGAQARKRFSAMAKNQDLRVELRNPKGVIWAVKFKGSEKVHHFPKHIHIINEDAVEEFEVELC